MPQPFDNFSMQEIQNWSKEDFKKNIQATMRDTTPTELNHAGKIAELSHYLVTNFRSAIQPGEHVIDTAIRLLKTAYRDL